MNVKTAKISSDQKKEIVACTAVMGLLLVPPFRIKRIAVKI